MNNFLQVFYAIFSGILVSYSIPNEFLTFGSVFIGAISLIPLYISLKNAKSYGFSALLCALHALTTHILSSYWLSNFRDFAIFTLGASALGTAGIEALIGPALHAIFRQSALNDLDSSKNVTRNKFAHIFSSKGFCILYFASVYTIYEWIKSTGFLAYPWGTLSMSAFNAKILIQSVDIFGTYGITFLFAWTSAFLAEVLLFIPKITFNYSNGAHKLKCFLKSFPQNLKDAFFALVAMFSLILIYGTFQYNKTLIPQKELCAVLVQQNMDPWSEAGDTPSIRTSMDLTNSAFETLRDQGKIPDIVIWSEGVLRYPFPQSITWYEEMPIEEPLCNFIKYKKVPFLIGGAWTLDESKKKYANAALMFDSNGKLCGFYGKRHLVPFAEVIPGIEFDFVNKLFLKLVGFSSGWTPGPQFTLFDINGKYSQKREIPAVNIVDVSKRAKPQEDYFNTEKGKPTKIRAATPICFEDAFPDICGPFHNAGAEVFLNITDDSWSNTNSAEYQHFVIAAFRAVEYRTTLVRCTNSGVTAVVNPKGNIIESLELFKTASLTCDIPTYATVNTVYSVFTNWFIYLLIIFVGLVLCQVIVSQKASNYKVLRTQ